MQPWENFRINYPDTGPVLHHSSRFVCHNLIIHKSIWHGIVNKANTVDDALPIGTASSINKFEVQ